MAAGWHDTAVAVRMGQTGGADIAVEPEQRGCRQAAAAAGGGGQRRGALRPICRSLLTSEAASGSCRSSSGPATTAPNPPAVAIATRVALSLTEDAGDRAAQDAGE